MLYSDLVDFISSTFQVQEVNNELATPFTDSNANLWLARAIDFAEQQIYTDMNFLATRQAQSGSSYALVANSRTFTLPSVCMQIEGVSVISPSTATPQTGTRNPCEMTSLDFIDMMFPNEQPGTGIPSYWAPKTDQILVFGQTPDQAYPLEITGIFRPTPIAYNNTSTYISLNYPQLLMSAIAVAWTGYQRDYGAQSEDPKLAVSWKQQYQDALAPAIQEEKRRRGLSQESSKTSPAGPAADPKAD